MCFVVVTLRHVTVKGYAHLTSQGASLFSTLLPLLICPHLHVQCTHMRKKHQKAKVSKTKGNRFPCFFFLDL